MLHILPGEATVASFRAAGLPGDVLPWAEMMSEGPTRRGLTNLADLDQRAQWIEQHYKVPADAYKGETLKLGARLDSLTPADECVLWFDRDLFCAVNLIACIARGHERGPRWTFAAEGAPHDPWLPRFQHRAPLSQEAVDFFVAAWRAYSGDVPTALEWLLRAHGPAWSPLTAPLRLHLERFPDTVSGLGRPERAILTALQEGARDISSVFQSFTAREPGYGWGDAQVALTLIHLSLGHEPLVHLDGAPAELPTLGAPMASWPAAFTLTDAGLACLAGAADRCDLNGLDQWLGGVHLRGRDPAWRWDAEDKALVEAGG